MKSKIINKPPDNKKYMAEWIYLISKGENSRFMEFNCEYYKSMNETYFPYPYLFEGEKIEYLKIKVLNV